MTSLPAVIARELGVPLVGAATHDAEPGTVVTVDGDRGVVYESDITGR
jgi:pyruvate kinase